MALSDIVGTGDLIADGESLGIVEYKISITQGRGFNSARGYIWADAMAIVQAFEATKTEINRHDNGYTMTIIVKAHNADGSAEIVVSGPPGP